ncbi:RDD family protein [Shewanella cyperi]|uniref:RDD family protein n=1 Tax=Shewanella cyperi TaxID=2814292 RepID=A0A975AKK0_9GAMM|nr:RDD family protein [Shewanella cyperi]QSX29283.1 RDD family protein [Shewanella cyperi]QSX40032.1 RDD family protein [Shewanella cyperi]
MINQEHANFPRAGFFRRLGAAVYDLLLAVAVWILAGSISFGIFTLLVKTGLIGMQGEQHVVDVLNGNPVYKGLNLTWILFCVGLFYALFWSKGGQTLGMRAWRLKVQHPNGQNLSLLTAFARLFWSLGGLGNLWILIHGDKLALQDRMTGSEVVVLSEAANQMRNWRGV